MTVQAQRLFFGSTRENLFAVLLGALLLTAFGPTLVELARNCWDRAEYGHGLLMPPVAAWMIWERRHELAKLRRRSAAPWMSILGALAFVPILTLLLLGEIKYSWFLKPYAFVGAVGAGVLVLYGWQGVRALMAPLVVLLLMCPWPQRILDGATLPLKHHASVLATGLMSLTGMNASLEGNMIHVQGIDSLWIADPCSGLRSLISLMSVAVLGCVFWKRSMAIKAVVVASAIPVSVMVNALRLWVTAFLCANVSKEAAEGFFHEFEGLVLFGLAAAILLGWGALLNYILPRRAESEVAEEDVAQDTPDRPFARRAAVGITLLLLAGATFGVYSIRAWLGGEGVDAAARARLQAAVALPRDLGEFKGNSIEWDKTVVEYSGADAYSAMSYRGKDGASVQLYLGAALRNDNNFHAPNVCMPSAGWEKLSHDEVKFDVYKVDQKDPRMQRLLLQRGESRMMVYYWFQAGARLAGDEMAVRRQRLVDLLKGRPLSPTLIVCVYVPVRDGLEATEKMAQKFLAAIGPRLRDITVSGGING